MKETEVKILEVNREKIEKTLAALGAIKVFDGELLTLFFDFQDGRIRKKRNVLRLRKEPEKVELTFKKARFEEKAKVAQEVSVNVSDADAITEILQEIGLEVTGEMQKHRTSYKFEGARFDIDKYGGVYGFIPEFMEIEGSLKEIRKYAEMLGFQEKDCFTWSTDELIRHYYEKQNR
ncbi:MAG: class IV adenylate cyclase [Candidatus Bathyarchaeota archaeon]|nr:class IV adenylate cyclase [Candidatus Bathyarchaeota archaeon]